jgi:hypothetical protein
MQAYRICGQWVLFVDGDYYGAFNHSWEVANYCLLKWGKQPKFN